MPGGECGADSVDRGAVAGDPGLPIFLGVLAALLGGYAFRKIERSEVNLSGDGFAFFSIMIGMFAALIGICTTFARLIWPILPSA